MNYGLAVGQMLEAWKERRPMGFLPLSRRDEGGMSEGHARWMLDSIVENDENWSDGKKGRWLGWAQALLCFHGYFRLKHMKEINLSCSCDDEGCPYFNTVHKHESWEVLRIPNEDHRKGDKAFRVWVPEWEGKPPYAHRVFAVDKRDALGDAWVNWGGYVEGGFDDVLEQWKKGSSYEAVSG